MEETTRIAVSPSRGELQTSLKGSLRRNRVWEIDFLRGVVFIIVFLYHACWDISMIPQLFSNYYDLANDSFRSVVDLADKIFTMPGHSLGVVIVAGTFLFLTGVCCTFSRNNALRGAKIFCWGMVITIATVVLSVVGQMNDMLIVFGILHCIGLTVLLYGLWEIVERKLNFKTPAWVYLILGLAFIGLGTYLEHWYPGYRGFSFQQMNLKNILGNIIGTSYSYGDSFPLFPNAGTILLGIGIGKLVYGGKRGKISICPALDGPWFAPVKFIGRHSLVLYLGEQVLGWVLIIGVLLPMGYTLSL